MPEDAKFIATLLSRSPMIAARLEEVQITDDVINRKILSRKKSHFGGTSYGDASVAQIDAVTNTPIPTHNPSNMAPQECPFVCRLRNNKE